MEEGADVTLYVVICAVAFFASALTFFSGFGLGTLLLPAFAVFFPVERAVALTAVVHFLNGVFKLFLVWRHIEWRILLRFGVTAIVGAFVGAWALLWLADAPPLLTYEAFGRTQEVTAAKVTVGLLLLFFACAEVLPAFRKFTFGPRYLPLGGVVSGFFGGLAGMQGALRSAFLIKAGLTKEAYVATGAAIAFLIDVSRLAVYARLIHEYHADFDLTLLSAAVVSAMLGATLGNRYLRKITMGSIQGIVAVLLFAVALGLLTGTL
jgi:uncharacterized membrane protein YfcA